MKTFLRKRVGRRGEFLLFLAMLDLIYAYSLFHPTATSLASPTIRFLLEVAPLGFWGCVWALVGVVCGVFAFRRNDAPGFAAAVSLKVFWALLFTLGWAMGEVERGYLSGAIWAAFGFIMARVSSWPEPKTMEDV